MNDDFKLFLTLIQLFNSVISYNLSQFKFQSQNISYNISINNLSTILLSVMIRRFYNMQSNIMQQFRHSHASKKSIGLLFGSFCYFNYSKILHKSYTAIIPQQQVPFMSNKQKIVLSSPSGLAHFISKIKNIMEKTIRFFQLLLIFSPCILLMPLRYFKYTEDIWLDIFVKSIQRAGVVWIKIFQYMSHRRDMIGQKMAKKFIHLRENAPQHSYQQTSSTMKKQFQKDTKQIFTQFDKVPIASGSVSQVYQAVYNGQKVAVKVRHPNVQKHIVHDLELLFDISNALSKISGVFQIPVGKQSLKKTLTEQIDFNSQANNLRTFQQYFKQSDNVKFPTPIENISKSSVLVESFVQGVPITEYETKKHALNKVIARIGATTFFKMLMQDNFIHADCHGGNILVSIKEKSYTLLDSVMDKARSFYRYFQNKFINYTFPQKVFRQLYLESKRQQDEVRNLQMKEGKKVEVTLIDVGMVIVLDQIDRTNFISFIKNFIKQKPEECAKMIYSLSLDNGKRIIDQNKQKYEKYQEDLNKLFEKIKHHTLKEINGTQLLCDMLDLIRQNKMKLYGEFATLLTNMLVLEAIAKDLYPEINILKCAIPYFKE